MCPILPADDRAPLLPRAEHMAKAALRNQESETGRAIQRAQQRCGWSLKEFAAHARRDERQLARWIDGSEHSQLDTLFAIVPFQIPLLVALAEVAGHAVKVTTSITIEGVA